MRIAIILPGLGMGGAERVATSLSNWIAKNKTDEIYFINMGENTHNFELDKNVKVYHKNYDTKAIKGFKPVVLLKKLKLKIDFVNNTLNEIKPDVIFEMLYLPLFFVLPYKRKHKNDVVIIGSERANPKAKNIKFDIKIMSKICPKMCDGYIFQTERVKQMFSKKIQEKSCVIPNAVSNPYMMGIIETRREKVISNMGRLENQKGQDVLIKAFNIVQKEHPEYKLVIYGEGSKRKKLKNLIEELNLKDKVTLAGKVKKAILEVNKSEIFVFTSRFEGMPNALMEAMACGLPCISTDCIAGPSEIIENGKNGILVEVDNVEQIAQKINFLIENKEKAKQMGNEARKILETHSTDKIFEKYYNYFSKISKKKEKENAK